MLRRMRDRLRYVDYRQAEQDCEILAAKILERWSRSELEGASFAAIPRGGLIVLGMLSYALGLKTAQLREGPGPLFLVDDCALTGARFASRLKTTDHREVVFVHLYSHPDLRRAIEEKEERVVACVAARDLTDMAPESFPDPERLAEWRRKWRERLGERYWYGQPEPVCFAWNEPDRPFWNEATGEVEDGWRLLPPHLCLKTRAALGGPPPGVQEPREWQAPDDSSAASLTASSGSATPGRSRSSPSPAPAPTSGAGWLAGETPKPPPAGWPRRMASILRRLNGIR